MKKVKKISKKEISLIVSKITKHKNNLQQPVINRINYIRDYIFHSFFPNEKIVKHSKKDLSLKTIKNLPKGSFFNIGFFKGKDGKMFIQLKKDDFDLGWGDIPVEWIFSDFEE